MKKLVLFFMASGLLIFGLVQAQQSETKIVLDEQGNKVQATWDGENLTIDGFTFTDEKLKEVDKAIVHYENGQPSQLQVQIHPLCPPIDQCICGECMPPMGLSCPCTFIDF